MTDRVLVYDAAIPQVIDILNGGKAAMIGDAFLARAILGGATAVHGLACAPTSPATLHVTVGAGSIYALDQVDATAYGDLGTDTNTILKQGILYNAVNLTITPPGTAGFSQVFLVQVILQDVDGGSEVVSYFNASNPSEPFAGPANDGLSQFTTRTCLCAVALKAGVAATTGTQTTPSADAGYTGLYAITVANGASTITSGNIVQLSTAPFFPTLPSIPGDVQGQLWTFEVDSSVTPNTVTLTPSPPIAAYAQGQRWCVLAGATNNGAVTATISGLGSRSIVRNDGSALQQLDYIAGQFYDLVDDGTQLRFVANGSAQTLQITSVSPTIYVRTDGNDSNDGTQNNAGHALATLARAYVLAGRYFVPGGQVNITFGNTGTFALSSPPSQLITPLVIAGNTAVPASYVIQGSTGVAVTSASVTFQNLTLKNTANTNHLLLANNGGNITVGNVEFAATGTGNTQAALISFAGGSIVVGAGGAQCVSNFGVFISAQNGGAISVQSGATVTMIGTPTFSVATAVATAGGNISAGGSTWTGAASGARYQATLNGVINTLGGGASFFPGSGVGSVATGGVYG